MNIQLMISGTVACLLAWCILAVAPACAQTITHVPQFTIMGNSAGELFGSSISGAGDVNGDGFVVRGCSQDLTAAYSIPSMGIQLTTDLAIQSVAPAMSMAMGSLI